MKDVNALFGMFDHRNVEATSMIWRKCDLWKAGIVLAGMILLLVWVPLSAASVYEGTSGLATKASVTMQATPTEDATVAALNKDKLAQEVQQLKVQNEPDFFGWLRLNVSLLLSTLIVVVGGLIGFFRWLADRRSERDKQAEARFQSAVTGLGDEKEGAKINAAILLRTFLRPGYEQFYTQTFDLAVANLRLPRTSSQAEDPEAPLPLTTLSQALIVVFKKACPLARSQNQDGPQSLDATGVQLDSAYLLGSNLKQVWMPQASLRNVDLSRAKLSGANLRRADLSGVDLSNTDLSGAKLKGAKLSGADLTRADLSGVDLSNTDLSGAKLQGAKLSGADLTGVDLAGVDLTGVDLSKTLLFGADLRRANLSEANFRGAYLSGTDVDPNVSGNRVADLKDFLRVSKLVRIHLNKTLMTGVKLGGANLSEANLRGAKFTRAYLRGACLSKADLGEVDLNGADLNGADLSEAKLTRAYLIRTKLGEANLSYADLRGTILIEADLSGANLEGAIFKKTDLREVKGLTKVQLEACKAKGAIIDEDPTASSSQSTAAPSPLPNNDVPTSSTPPAQGNLPTPDTDESNAVPPQQEPES